MTGKTYSSKIGTPY